MGKFITKLLDGVIKSALMPISLHISKEETE